MFHSCKYDVVQEDGFQYCKVCGKAIRPKQQSCQHIWKDKHTMETFIGVGFDDRMSGIVYVQQCTKCGEIKRTKIGA